MAMRYSKFLDGLLKSSLTPQSGTELPVSDMEEGSGHCEGALDWTSLQSNGSAGFGDFLVPFDPIFSDLFSIGI